MILKITMIAVTTTLLSLILKQYRPEYTLFLQLGACVGIIILLMSNFNDISDSVRSLTSVSGIDGSSFKSMWKVLGIALITQFASDLCRDSGESALAGNVELAGKWLILLYSLPFLQMIAKFAVDLVKDM